MFSNANLQLFLNYLKNLHFRRIHLNHVLLVEKPCTDVIVSSFVYFTIEALSAGLIWAKIMALPLIPTILI